MKLVYTRWKDVKKFLACIDEPVSDVFYLRIRKLWLRETGWQKYHYEVEIPESLIELVEADNRSE